ncbi:hypothetical protein C0992_001596 [Termitomyces sp. T32_za158]|nr:hypothetical protein C0992_001596 [Termitomyces sp. T32_za158]
MIGAWPPNFAWVMLSHVLPSHPPALLIPKYLQHSHFASPKPLHPPSYSLSYPASLSPLEPDSPATVEDEIPSPNSPHSGSGSYRYAHRSTGSFDSPISPAEMYESHLQLHSYSSAQQSYLSEQSSHSNYQVIDNDGTLRGSQFDRPCLSESPSPVDPPSTSSYPADISSNPPQGRRTSYIPSSYLAHEHYDASRESEADRHSRNIGSDKYSENNNPHSQAASTDQRRLSEPAALSPPNPYSNLQPFQRIQPQPNYTMSSLSVPRSSAYFHSLQRGASTGSLRDLRHVHPDSPAHSQSHYTGFKDNNHLRSHQLGGYHETDGFDAPISPLQSDFTGGMGPREAGARYSPTAENLYGTSPPGTGTSASSLGPLSPAAESFNQKHDINSNAGDNGNKTYSFVALPGNTVKKRPRRRYDEIERLYQCSWPDCNKAYGTLNHLNAHVTMQKHGPKRQPSEFKELRKQWRKAKKSVSPGPVRRYSVLRHDNQEYDTRHYESQSESNTSLLTCQPPYYASTSVPSSGPSVLSEPSDRLTFPVEGSRYTINEREEHSAIYSVQGRQRNSSTTWPGITRPHPQQQYLPSLSPDQQSGFVQDSDAFFPSDTRGPHSQRSRSQSSLEPSMGRLPPDSTLLTPLPGYQSSLLPPLQEGEHQDVRYPAGTDYEMFDNGRDRRSHTGHRSIGDDKEKY